MLFLIGGCFLVTALLVILVPILLPRAKSFGGTCLFVACSISRKPLSRVFRPLWPDLVVMVLMLGLVTYWPWLTLIGPQPAPTRVSVRGGGARRGSRRRLARRERSCGVEPSAP